MKYMFEVIGVVFFALLIVAIGVPWHLKKKRQEIAVLANGEYLNWSKAERILSAPQKNYPMETEYSSEHTIQEAPGIYTTKNRNPKNTVAKKIINKVNENFVEKRLIESKNLFDKLELTEDQRLAVVRDEDTNLINAGAGSGKTRTILSKMEYLIERRLAKPAEILVIVYNKKTQQEIKQKSKNIDPNITVSTFHALGLNVIKKVESDRVTISDFTSDSRKVENFLSQQMRKLLKDPSVFNLLINFFSTHHFEGDPEEGIKTKDEYFRKIRYVGLRSLDGTKLKSHQEVQIANWLILNGIKWEYEKDYPHNDSKKQHKPDFYLPDYDLWIEHFGIDEHGNTSPWVEKEKYNSEIEWKRKTHAANKTQLLETYSYESKNNGGLTQALANKLAQYKVTKTSVSDQDIDRLVAESFKPTSNFIKLVAQFLSLSRENKFSDQKLTQRITSARDGAFLVLFNLFRKSYEKKLKENNDIDFTDMIVRGLEYVKAGKYQSPYQYILVDEYQDITKVRLDFLLALQYQVQDARLFCVGDDWQSIYQFQGANVALITRFEDYVGAMQRTDLNKTFRYSQKINDFSNIFITQNPAQLKKSVHSNIASEEDARPIRIIYHDPKKQRAELERIIDLIARQSHHKKKTCFVLGRYQHNKPDSWQAITKRAKSKGIDMEFSTIHKSKGRESDWVVVAENKSDMEGYSFPSEIQDDPVLRMVKMQRENFPNAEERRLFYVAVTRTRKGVFLLVPDGEASEFIKEIDPRMGKEANHASAQSKYEPFVHVVKKAESKVLVCPECEGQTIRKVQTSADEFFYGCSYFPLCAGKLPTCENENCAAAIDLKGLGRIAMHTCACGHESVICPECRCGILQKRAGKHGKFWGCSQYGSTECQYTKNILQ